VISYNCQWLLSGSHCMLGFSPINCTCWRYKNEAFC